MFIFSRLLKNGGVFFCDFVKHRRMCDDLMLAANCGSTFASVCWLRNKDIFVSEMCHSGVCHLLVTLGPPPSARLRAAVLRVLPASASATISPLHLFVWKPP